MSEELTIERIRELRAAMTLADCFDYYTFAPEAIDFLLAKIDEMRAALKRAEWDFNALISRGDLADEPRAYETLNILRAALAQHHVEGEKQ